MAIVWGAEVSVVPIAASRTGQTAWGTEISVVPLATPSDTNRLIEIQIRRVGETRWKVWTLPRPGASWSVPTKGMRPGTYEVRGRYYSITERGDWSAVLTFTKV